MMIKNWLVYEQQRDSYIMDGISKPMAEILARRDCRKNPYEKAKKAAEARDLHDMEKVYGKTFSIGGLFSDVTTKITTKCSRYGDLVLSVMLIVFLLALAIGISTVIDGAIIYFIWNVLVVSAFGTTILSWEQALVAGFIMSFVLSIFKGKAK